MAPKRQRSVEEGSEPAAAAPAALAPAALAAHAASERARGVVYLSRVPPYMKPIKMRHLLEKYGALGRVYLAPEDDAAYARRTKAGGNKRQLFTEAWVEFMDKKVAKSATPLNSFHRNSSFFDTNKYRVFHCRLLLVCVW